MKYFWGRWRVLLSQFMSKPYSSELKKQRFCEAWRYSPEKWSNLIFLYYIQRHFIKMIQPFFVIISFLSYSSIYPIHLSKELKNSMVSDEIGVTFIFSSIQRKLIISLSVPLRQPWHIKGRDCSLPWWICREGQATFGNLLSGIFPSLPPH